MNRGLFLIIRCERNKSIFEDIHNVSVSYKSICVCLCFAQGRGDSAQRMNKSVAILYGVGNHPGILSRPNHLYKQALPHTINLCIKDEIRV